MDRNSKQTILVIDDELSLRAVYARLLKYEGYLVVEAATGREGVKKADASVDLILCDVKLPDGSGLDKIFELKKAAPRAEIIMLTAYGSISDGVEAMRRGAFDYLTKGDSDDQLLVRVGQALHAVHKPILLRKQLIAFADLIGQSVIFKRAVLLAETVANTDAAILLTGPTGSGKELFAQAMHSASERNTAAFVSINCAALPRETLESELFGYAKGAFTGAIAEKKGLVEEAEKGTLFLDEIGELPVELQPKLLRFLETGEFYRMGETKPRQVDVRLISATNRNLLLEMKAGGFRGDLYYRLAVVEITLPSLLERGKNDIEALAVYFLRLFSQRHNKPDEPLTTQQMEQLNAQVWPGNVRELRNVMERVVLLGFDNALPKGHSARIGLPQIISDFEGLNLGAMERKLITKALEYTYGNKTQAAKVLGIGLTTLYRKIEELGIG